MRLKEASLKEVDLQSRGWDDFIFTYKPDIGEIAASLKRLGQINPVILEEMEKDASHPACPAREDASLAPALQDPEGLQGRGKESRDEGQHPKGRYRIVAGYARVLAAKKIGWEKIEAKIFDAGEIPAPKLFFLALATKASGGNISAVEKALALKKAIDLFGFEEEEVRREIARLVDVPPSKEVIRNYISLAEADEALKDAVHLGRFSASQAFLLFPFKAADRLALFNLLQNLSANFNETKEILRNISDLAKLQKRPIKEILALEEIKGILPDETLSRRQKTENVRQVLKKLRYPRLSEMEEDFERQVKELGLSGDVRIQYPPFFEREYLDIRMTIRSPDELEDYLCKLLRSLEEGRILHLFALLRGEIKHKE